MKYLGDVSQGRGQNGKNTDKGSVFHITGAIDIWATSLFITRDCSGHYVK